MPDIDAPEDGSISSDESRKPWASKEKLSRFMGQAQTAIEDLIEYAAADRLVNVRDARFGMVVDGVTSNNVAFRAAFDYAASLDPVGAVYIPTGDYVFDTSTPPIRVVDAELAVLGDGVSSTIAGTAGAFVLQTAPQMAALPIVAGLPADRTHEFALDFHTRIGETFYIQLSDGMTPGYLNGRSAFCVQGFYKPTDTTETAMLAFSRGRLRTSLTENYCFRLEVNSSDRSVRGHLVVSGVTYQCNTAAAAISAGNMYDIAMTFDGSNIRIFVDGTLSATTAAVGTITQAKWERVVQGTLLRDCWGSETQADGPRGVMSHWEIANVVRHTSGYTKRTAFGEDSNTVVSTRIPFNTYYTDAAIRLGGGAFPWVPVYQEYFGTGTVGDTRFRDFKITGGCYGIFSAANIRGYYDGLTISGASQYGMMLYDNNYFSQVGRCEIWGGRVPFVTAGASGVMTVRDTTLRGGLVNCVSVGSGLKFDNVFFQGENTTLINCLVDAKGGSAAGYQFNFCFFSDEAGSGPLITNLLADSCRHVSAYGCNFEHASASDDANVILDTDSLRPSGFPVTLDSCDFTGNGPSGGTNILIYATGTTWKKGHVRVFNYNADAAGAPDANIADNLSVDGRDAYEITGHVDIADAATSAAVAFTTAEPDAAYELEVSGGVQTGAPAAGSASRVFWSSKATGGFTANTEVAPGAGTSIRVSYRLKRG